MAEGADEFLMTFERVKLARPGISMFGNLYREYSGQDLTDILNKCSYLESASETSIWSLIERAPTLEKHPSA